MRTIAIIPARGGSKGIFQKNIIDFCGKPLLAWTILQARQSSYVEEVYVSSDDDQILDTAKQYGALPIKRPDALAGDTSTSESAILHALDQIEVSPTEKVDWVVFLQATSPLREPEDIDGAIHKLMDSGADSLLSATVLDDVCAFKMDGNQLISITYDPFNRGRRQDREKVYHDNGSIYIFRPDILRTHNNRLGGKIAIFEMPFWKSYEIDKTEDIELCRYFFTKKLAHRYQENDRQPLMSEKDLDLIVYDFDGVMTDNRVFVMEDGREGVFANRGDGQGINIIRKMGFRQIILSTEKNPVVGARAKKVGLSVIQGADDKADVLARYCKAENLDLNRVAFIGNDVNDLAAMKLAGLPVAPSDAHPEVKKVAKLVLKSVGGSGVIREFADYLALGDES